MHILPIKTHLLPSVIIHAYSVIVSLRTNKTNKNLRRVICIFDARQHVVLSAYYLSVTTRYRTKPGWDRDSGFSRYDNFLWPNSVPVGEENEDVEEEIVISPLLARLVWERLQIDTDLLTSFPGVPTSMTSNDSEPQKWGVW